MSYNTPPGWADRCMMMGDGGDHEIRIFGQRSLAVYCICDIHRALGRIRTAEQALTIYRKHEQRVLAMEQAS